MSKHPEINYVEIINWTRSRYTQAEITTIQRALGMRNVDGIVGPKTVDAICAFQLMNNLVPDGKIGRQTLAQLDKERLIDKKTVVDFDAAEVEQIIKATVLHESAGRKNPYAAQNRDLEYEGYFDRPTRNEDGSPLPPVERPRRHWASKYKVDGGAHIGLSWGMIQFTQDSSLGKVLSLAYAMDRATFVRIMGAGDETLAQALVNTTNRSGSRKKQEGGARSPRVQPVGGADLWKKPWIDRFDEAAEEEVFQRAQRIVAGTDYLLPALKLVLKLGAEQPSQEDLAVAFDMCVHFGPGKFKHDPKLGRDVGTTGAAKQWERAYSAYGRGVIASEVVRMMSSSDRSRREKIMRAVDENRLYNRAELERVSANTITSMLLGKYVLV